MRPPGKVRFYVAIMLCVSANPSPGADESAGSAPMPSLEFLEFLGEWADQDDFFDVALEEELKSSKHDKEANE
ncbi:MAG: hypothetical protein AAF384_10130 [Pseudomonadota bacterium]